ncbi:MAG: D-alanyl-D-alanine carboxypeptidase [Peptoniphilaceae bacterium]|nr:D-alanyl-D-alanine carboxypeptidase [Peptoniphilaceae bacterium]MDY6019500.1 D-alanyl-D-alanine carboxypeptidase family protein [Anaerococcus sp.]
MKIREKIASLFFSFIILFSPSLAFAKNQDQVVGYDSQVRSYIIGNQAIGEIFYEKNADKSYPIASMSKLMTYLLTKEAIAKGEISTDQTIKASKEAEKLTSWEYSHLGLKEGEVYTIDELLKGLMVVSGNDCAYELARAVGGSEKKFVKQMNEKAKSLGLDSQSYYNADGLQTEDEKQNSSSARDMFRLSQVIIKEFPEVLEYAKIRKIEDKKRDIEKNSTIPLVDEVEGVDGLKTGSTAEAGFCVTTTVDMKKLDDNDSFRTIAVVMGAESDEIRNLAMKDLIYYVSKYYNSKEVLNTNLAAETLKLNTVSSGYVELYPVKSLSFIIKNGTVPATKYKIKDNIKAPIKAGEKLGDVEVYYNDQTYDVALVTKEKQNQASKFIRLVRVFKDTCNFLLECIIAR